MPQEPQIDFTDRTIVITGAASGMGEACVNIFSANGANVVAVDRDESGLDRVSANRHSVRTVVGDVANSSLSEIAIEEAVSNFGRVDVLVNAAGIILRAGTVDTDDAGWQQVMDVNVNGVFYMCRAAVRQMLKQTPDPERGAIVNFGSVAGKVIWGNQTAYCASKGAVHQITRSIALDHATDKIRVNAVCPGEIETPMLKSGRDRAPSAEDLHALAQTVPMKRLGQADEVARVVAFLASTGASYMTGSLVDVDAGYTIP